MFNTCLIGIVLSVLTIVLIPHTSNFEMLTVMSPSMSPTIPMGSVIILDTENINEIIVGDIVTFRSFEIMEENVTHRVVNVVGNRNGLMYRTQGDANSAADRDFVSHSSINGKYLFHFPLVGYLIQFVRMPVGLLSVVIIPALLVIVGEVRELLKIFRDSKRFKYAKD